MVAKLTIFALQAELERVSGARDFWKALADVGELPCIQCRVPFTREDIWWGALPDGFPFFVTDLHSTKYGFECQIKLYAGGAHTLPPFHWLKECLFPGLHGIKGGAGDKTHYWFFPEDGTVAFLLENLAQEN